MTQSSHVTASEIGRQVCCYEKHWHSLVFVRQHGTACGRSLTRAALTEILRLSSRVFASSVCFLHRAYAGSAGTQRTEYAVYLEFDLRCVDARGFLIIVTNEWAWG